LIDIKISCAYVESKGRFFKCRHHKMSSGVKSADLGGMDDQYTISTSYKNAAVFHLESNKDCQ
jgi:hypothetical protein